MANLIVPLQTGFVFYVIVLHRSHTCHDSHIITACHFLAYRNIVKIPNGRKTSANLKISKWRW